MVTQRVGLMCLPDELLLTILLNLRQGDLFACMLVCKRLHFITLDHSLCKCTVVVLMIAHQCETKSLAVPETKGFSSVIRK